LPFAVNIFFAVFMSQHPASAVRYSPFDLCFVLFALVLMANFATLQREAGQEGLPLLLAVQSTQFALVAAMIWSISSTCVLRRRLSDWAALY
jgi:hypothetical protein